MKIKTTSVIFVVLIGLVAVHGAPAQTENEKDDGGIVIVPLEYQHPVGLFPRFNRPQFQEQRVAVDGPSFFNPFADVIQNLEAMMARMRQQFNQVLSRLPSRNATDDIPEIRLPEFGEIDLDKGNTTSVTKIINGHKVVINETEYKSDGDNGGAVIRVRVVDVHPEESDETTEANAEVIPTTTDVTKDVESVEASVENEIPKIQENEGNKYMNLETFDEVDFLPSQKQSYKTTLNQENFEDTNDIEAINKPVDLSNDIYVNQLLADAGAPANPDAEVFDPIEAEINYKYKPSMKFEKIVDPR